MKPNCSVSNTPCVLAPTHSEHVPNMSPLPLAGEVAVSAAGEGFPGYVSPTSYRPIPTA